MTKFQTLLQREWMQHQRGWLLMMLVPLVLILLVTLFGPADPMSVEFNVNGDRTHLETTGLMLMFISTAAVTAMVLFVTWIAVTFQAPGQARRDHQDRSIEFWLSMPVSHGASIGAMLLMQFFIVPLLALAVGWFGSQIIGMVAVARFVSPSALFDLPWGALLVANLALLARLGMGLVLVALWFSPLLLLGMVASAWLKRWGVAAVIALIAGGGLLLNKLYGVTWVFDALDSMMKFGARAVINIGSHSDSGLQIHGPQDVPQALSQLPAFMLHDGMAALRDCGEPLFLGGLLFSAACFALLVLHRSRGG